MTNNGLIICMIFDANIEISTSFGLILFSLHKLNVLSDVMIYTLNR